MNGYDHLKGQFKSSIKRDFVFNVRANKGSKRILELECLKHRLNSLEIGVGGLGENMEHARI